MRGFNLIGGRFGKLRMGQGGKGEREGGICGVFMDIVLGSLYMSGQSEAMPMLPFILLVFFLALGALSIKRGCASRSRSW